LRQAIAASILLISVDAINKKKLIRFLFLVFIAFTFHRSAMIFLPLYFLSKIKFNKSVFIGGFAIYALEFVALVTVAKNLIQAVLVAFGKSSYSISGFSLTNLTLLLIASLLFFMLVWNMKQNCKEKDYNLICAGLWLGVFLQLGSSYLDLIGRIYTGYFLLFFALAFSWAMRDMKKQSRSLYYLGSIMLCGMLFAYYILNLNGNPNVPFVPFWQTVA
jgi:hypothetical protein